MLILGGLLIMACCQTITLPSDLIKNVLENGRDRFEGKGKDLLADPQVGALYLGAAFKPE